VTIYTVSYEGRSLQEFIAGLLASDVRLVADVREAPISRKRGFAKSALSEALQRAGIGYCHLRALGCPKAIRDRYKQDKDWARYTAAFMAHLSEQRAAVAELAARTEAQPTALLCYEADFNRCHRTYVARAVSARTGSDVCHLTASGPVPDQG
jgi:uncharacterized protein (DUF488 family)